MLRKKVMGDQVVVLGGAGFVGRSVVNALSKAGYHTKVAVRRPQRYRDYALFPNTQLVQMDNLQDAEALQQLFRGADIVISLIADQTSGAEAVAPGQLVSVSQQVKKAVELAGVKRVLSLSQIGADANNAQQAWLCELGEMDSVLHAMASAKVTLVKPSVLLGEGDQITTCYRKQLKRLSILPVVHADTLIQPLAVEDFAQAWVQLIEDKDSFGSKIEMVGEERLSVKDLADTVRTLMLKEDAMLFPMCRLNAKFMVALGILAPFQSVSKVQLLSLANDSVSDMDFESRFGFMPQSVEHSLAHYVMPNNMRERYNFMRREAGRDADELVS